MLFFKEGKMNSSGFLFNNLCEEDASKAKFNNYLKMSRLGKMLPISEMGVAK